VSKKLNTSVVFSSSLAVRRPVIRRNFPGIVFCAEASGGSFFGLFFLKIVVINDFSLENWEKSGARVKVISFVPPLVIGAKLKKKLPKTH